VEPGLTPGEYRATWDAKPALRAVYAEYYRWIDTQRRPGPTIEIGSGPGNLTDELPDVIATDITPSRYIGAALHAHELPFATGALANIVGIDVLHHLERPVRFLAEAQRTLRDGGRLILVEPSITPVSWVFYKLFHPEPIDLRADPFADGPRDPNRDPADANQAIPTLLSGRKRDRMEAELPELRVVTKKRCSFFAYPLSGGFRRWSAIPRSLVKPLQGFERAVRPALGWLMAFRLFLVVEHRTR
jgi:SAM-dependent methyltransferase